MPAGWVDHDAVIVLVARSKADDVGVPAIACRYGTTSASSLSCLALASEPGLLSSTRIPWLADPAGSGLE